MGKVRIIGGIYRSRILGFKDEINGLRPTPDRVRETVFNWLGQDLSGKVCLDLFAGSGALGFEALSRGAKHVTMVEKDQNIARDLRLNQEKLNAPNMEIMQRNALNYLDLSTLQFDVIFLDPPYTGTLLTECLSVLKASNVLAPNGIIYIEYKTAPDLSGYTIVKQSKAGVVNYMLIQPELSEGTECH